MLKTIAFVGLAVINLVGASMTEGQCAYPTLQQNFDPSRYVGFWWEQARDIKSPGQGTSDCTTGRYTLRPDGSVGVFNNQYNLETGRFGNSSGYATFSGAQGKVYFPDLAEPGDYRVLYTDYDEITIVYACYQQLKYKTEFLWILTRDQNPDESIMKLAYQVVKDKVPEYPQADSRRTYHGDKCQYRDAPSAHKHSFLSHH